MAESKFKRLEGKLSKRPGVTDPAALAAYIGDRKYGAKEMGEKSAASRKERERKKRDSRLHSRKRH